MQDESKLTPLGKLVVFLFIAGSLYGAYYVLSPAASPNTSGTTGTQAASTVTPIQGGQIPVAEKVSFGIAYGTEKDRWMKAAVEAFKKTPQGANIEINRIPKGSIESAQAILQKDTTVHVWCPASSLEKDQMVSEWVVRYGNDPIIKGEKLALTPLVFVMPLEREKAFLEKYKEISFATVAQAFLEPGGWEGITSGREGNWGSFKFGHTDPRTSNSGVLTLILMAYSFQNKVTGLTKKDVLDPKFRTWLSTFEAGVTKPMPSSTGDMMKEMIMFGVSKYDGVVVYENVAIDYLEAAKGRGLELRITYPKNTIWSDNPYYILDVPWSSPDQRKAAETFLHFLMTDDIQKQALKHGFRPGNLDIQIAGVPDSPFEKNKNIGLKIQGFQLCDPPPSDVLNELRLLWERR
jgi:ABC-type glycerol-3-phosphate transport system substrate-binding protein